MNLVIVEEAQAIVGWETIREVIFHEAHYRKNEASSASSSSSFETSSESSPSMAYASPNAQSDAAQHSDQEAPLRTLTDTDFFTLKVCFFHGKEASRVKVFSYVLIIAMVSTSNSIFYSITTIVASYIVAICVYLSKTMHLTM